MAETELDDYKKLKKNYRKFFGWGALVVFVLWALSGIVIYWLFHAGNNYGTFGDMFGAINALFSGLAFLGVILTIFLQSKELEYQRIELKKSIEAQKDSATALDKQWKINRFATELNTINNMITYFNDEIGLLKKTSMNAQEAESYKSMLAQKKVYVTELTTILDEYRKKKGEIYGQG